MKTLLKVLPEYYLIGLVILAAYSPPLYIHPIFAVLILILVVQIILKNKVMGIVIGCLFFLINLYFLGALLSEFSEFKELNYSAMKLLTVGLSVWIINLIMSSSMIYKYWKKISVDASKNLVAHQKV